MENKYTVLFICSSDVHVRMFYPVLTSSEFTRHYKPYIYTLDQYYNYGSCNEINRLNIPFPVINSSCNYTFRKPLNKCKYLQTLLFLFTLINIEIKKLLNNCKPSIILLGNDIGFIERYIIKRAKYLNIKTVLIQEGTISSKSRSGLKYKIRYWITDSILRPLGLEYIGSTKAGKSGCDIIAVFGNSSKRELEKLNISKHNIRIIGNLRNDYIITNHLNIKKNLNLNCKKNNFIFVYFCSGIREQLNDEIGFVHEIEEICLIYELLKDNNINNGNWNFGLRLHPRSSPESYLNYLKNELTDKRFFLLKPSPIDDTISCADCCILSFSAVYYEIVMMNKPCIVSSVSFKKIDKYYKIIKDYPLDVFSEKETLQNALNNIIDHHYLMNLLNKQKNQLSDSILFDENSSATRKLIEIFDQLIEKDKHLLDSTVIL